MKRAKNQVFNIPNRWINCPNVGSIVNDLFVPFKTPLDEQYDDQMSPDDEFHLQSFLSSSEAEKVGMVINLTKTDRYYDANVLKSMDKIYKKIQCEGHDGPPTKAQVEIFSKICSDFFEENDGLYIGVHCTHGFNRTGFMIISYLCDNYEVKVDEAVEYFAAARSPGIYKQDYLDELAVRYNHIGKLLAPKKPDWCSESPKTMNKKAKFDDFDLDNLTDEEDSSSYSLDHNSSVANNNSKYKSKTNNSKNERKPNYSHKPNKIPKFMEGVTGVSTVTDETIIEEVQQKVRELLNSTKPGFLGSHPVSMTQENLKLIAYNDYMVSWKADGTRYIMLIADKDMVYMFDRDNCVYKVDNIHLLKNQTEYHSNTVLDGEMVIDTYQNQKFPRYLIYDVMNLSGTYVGNKPFAERLNIIKKHVIDVRGKFVSPELRQKESFGIRIKDFWPISKASGLWEGKFRQELLHEMDGLIFQPSGPEDVYVHGRCNSILKWKPAHLNSIDFHLKCKYVEEKDYIPSYVGFLYVGGKSEFFDKIEQIRKPLREKYNNKIVECTLNNKTRKWEIIRERTDKSIPNHISTATSVLDSIYKPVHIQHVYSAIKKKLNP